jgi:transcriptional regulator NrdR family protein
MKCPTCGAWVFVKDTRTLENNTKRRRIECANMHRFFTLETIIVPKAQVHKKQKAPPASK